jgi:hypothetical protein
MVILWLGSIGMLGKLFPSFMVEIKVGLIRGMMYVVRSQIRV